MFKARSNFLKEFPRAFRHVLLLYAPQQDRISREIQKEEREGLKYILLGRLIVLSILAAWASTLPFERSANYFIALGIFSALSLLQHVAVSRGSGHMLLPAIFVVVDASILTYMLVTPPTFYVEGWTAQLNSRLPNFLYLGIYLVSMALSYSPFLVLWTGIVTCVTWSTGFIWIASLRGSSLNSSSILDADLPAQEVIRIFLDPTTVSVTTLFTQLVFLTITTLVLTLAVWRARRLIRRQVSAQNERERLSRYFSPNLVDELSTKAELLERPVVQPVAVLFADMVGFTSVTERLNPAELLQLLREFHTRLAESAFSNGGTVDKFIGDSIMVHFGTPRTSYDDPVRALRCAAKMLDEIDKWNMERARSGLGSIAIGIGIHYGDVLVGSVGHAQRLEYTILGDTVNVANRLERLTRRSESRLMVSDTLAQAVRNCGVEPTEIVPGLRPETVRRLRGRNSPVAIWSLPA